MTGVELEVPQESGRSAHPSSLDALRRYAQLRDRYLPRPSSPSFFLSTTGTRLDARVIHKLFPRLVNRAGLEQRAGRRPSA